MRHFKHQTPFHHYCESREEIESTYSASKLLVLLAKLNEPVNVHFLEKVYRDAEIEQYRKELSRFIVKK